MKQQTLWPMEEDEGEVIFVRWFRHHQTGKIIRPKNGKVIAIHIRKRRR